MKCPKVGVLLIIGWGGQSSLKLFSTTYKHAILSGYMSSFSQAMFTYFPGKDGSAP